MPRLDLDDGYTVHTATEPNWKIGDIEYTELPVVSFAYRPALPEALADWRMKLRRATTGREEAKATADLLATHLVSWDVRIAGGDAAINPETCIRIPEPIQDQLTRHVIRWAPKAEDARGNS